MVESATLPLHILVDHAEFKSGMSTANSSGVAIGVGAAGVGAEVPQNSHSLTSRRGTGWRKKK